MQSIWVQDDPTLTLAFGSLFDVAYPKGLLPPITDLRRLHMPEPEVNRIASASFEHPSLDLEAIFQEFRLSGSLSAVNIEPIQSFLGECQNDVKFLEAKIRATISTISQLSIELTQASARIVQKVSQTRLCGFLLSPQKHLPKHLPQDVLEEVFRACLATNESYFPKPNRAPLQLAAVCHRWRAIALSMPVLWNCLYIRSPGHPDLARTWLNRCYRPSLVLYIEDASVSLSKLQELLDALYDFPHFPPVIDVDGLYGRLGDISRQFILDRHQPALEELVIRGNDGMLPSLPIPLLRFYSQILPQTFHHNPPPTELTVLWLTPDVHPSTLTIFLANCHNLESIYVSLNEEGLQVDHAPLETKEITLYRLYYLGIGDRSEMEGLPEDLLQNLRFPSLRIVEYCNDKASELWLGLVHLLRSAQRLTLQAHEQNFSLEYLEHILKDAKSLSELAISTNGVFMSDIMTVLAPVALPTLRNLYLDIADSQLNKWLSFQPQLTTFARLWSSKSTTQSPLQLFVEEWYEDGDDQNKRQEHQPKALEVKHTLQAACSDVCIQIMSLEEAGWFWGVPMSFGMVPLPSNAADGRYYLLGDDGYWKKRSGFVYEIM